MNELSDIIAIGSDHAGVQMKAYIIDNLSDEGFHFHDFGTMTEESVDYPDIAHALAKEVESGKYRFGVLMCGSGNGVAIVANKYPGIRAAICWTKELAKLARLHNDANILVLPARFIKPEEALENAKEFFSTDFEGGRHQRRVDKISQIL